MLTPSTEISIKAVTPGELAGAYSVSVKTLNRWLRAHRNTIGIRNGRYFTTRQVQLIYKCIGSPLSTLIEP